MQLFNLFNKKCHHNSVPLDVSLGYCTECGELVENHWFITRCECCGLKMRATVRDGVVIPEVEFCKNCGSNQYKVEEIEKLDCINLHYAILVRKIVENEVHECVQSWLEAMQTVDCKPKLLRQFR